MRSAREITFRLRQEAANALLYVSPPNLKLQATRRSTLLPDPTAVATRFAIPTTLANWSAMADEIVLRPHPDLRPRDRLWRDVAWRRDPATRH